MESILVLSEDSGILLFADSYLGDVTQFDSLGVFQLSSSLFALYKLSFDCGTREEHSLKWLRKGESLLLFSSTSEPQCAVEKTVSGKGLLVIITFDNVYNIDVAKVIADRITTFLANLDLNPTQSLRASEKRSLQSNLEVLYCDILSDLFVQLLTVETSNIFSGIFSGEMFSTVKDDAFILLHHVVEESPSSVSSSSSSCPILTSAMESVRASELQPPLDERRREEVVQEGRSNSSYPRSAVLTAAALADRVENERSDIDINNNNRYPRYMFCNRLYKMIPCCRIFHFNANFNFNSVETDTNSTALRTCTAAVQSHAGSLHIQSHRTASNRAGNGQLDRGTGHRGRQRGIECSVPIKYLVLRLKGRTCAVSKQNGENALIRRFFEEIIHASIKSLGLDSNLTRQRGSNGTAGSDIGSGTGGIGEGNSRVQVGDRSTGEEIGALGITSRVKDRKAKRSIHISGRRTYTDNIDRAVSVAKLYNPARAPTIDTSSASKRSVTAVAHTPTTGIFTVSKTAVVHSIDELSEQPLDQRKEEEEEEEEELGQGGEGGEEEGRSQSLVAGARVAASSEESAMTYQIESCSYLGMILIVCTPLKTSAPLSLPLSLPFSTGRKGADTSMSTDMNQNIGTRIGVNSDQQLDNHSFIINKNQGGSDIQHCNHMTENRDCSMEDLSERTNSRTAAAADEDRRLLDALLPVSHPISQSVPHTLSSLPIDAAWKHFFLHSSSCL